MYVSGIFTIVPTTQYVFINQVATFECAIDDTGYMLGFNVPGVTPCDTTVTDLPGGGQQATYSFKVTSGNNGTRVRCTADDGNNLLYHEVYAYAQGKW